MLLAWRASCDSGSHFSLFASLCLVFLVQVGVVCSSMDEVSVPVCPPSWKLAQSKYVALATHLRAHNWAWGDEMLACVITLLLKEGIADARALHDVDLADADGAQCWPNDVWRYMDCLTHVLSTPCPVAVPVAPKPTGGLKRTWDLANGPAIVLDVAGATPLAALNALEASLPADPASRAEWRCKARTAAVLGSGPRSIASFRSGVKHWTKFIMITHGNDAAETVAFPPRLDDVLAWSNTFRYAFAHMRVSAW